MPIAARYATKHFQECTLAVRASAENEEKTLLGCVAGQTVSDGPLNKINQLLVIFKHLHKELIPSGAQRRGIELDVRVDGYSVARTTSAERTGAQVHHSVGHTQEPWVGIPVNARVG